MRRRWLGAAIGAGALALAGCASSSTSSAGHAGTASASATKSDLTVSAAASLKDAFTAYGRQFSSAHARFSFAGSDMLAAQIQQGLKPDVFASANLKLPKLLYAKRLVSKPVTFAANKLVLAVPSGSSRVKRFSDVEKPGVTLAIGSATVPIGAYTRTVLEKLGPGPRARVLANVRSDEPDVTGIVGKLTEGAVDAGFTYVSDVQATKGKLASIALPASVQPVVAYGVAIVRGSTHQAQAQEFIAGLLSGPGQADLSQAGFLPPPAK